MASWNSLVAAVRKHEEGHISTGRETVKDFNAVLNNPYSFTAEDCTKEVAKNKAIELGNAKRDALQGNLDAADEADQKAYHERVGTHINPGDYLR